GPHEPPAGPAGSSYRHMRIVQEEKNDGPYKCPVHGCPPGSLQPQADNSSAEDSVTVDASANCSRHVSFFGPEMYVQYFREKIFGFSSQVAPRKSRLLR